MLSLEKAGALSATDVTLILSYFNATEVCLWATKILN